MLVNDKAALRRILAHAGIGLMACCAMTDAAHAADAAVASVPPAQCGAGSRPEGASLVSAVAGRCAGGTDLLPVDNLAHEAEWSPDGRTYWIASNAAGLLSAIDVSDPAKPRNIYYGGSSIFLNHGMSFNADGTRMYLASMFPAGLVVLDVSDIQLRRGGTPRVRQLARLKWDDGSISQQATSVSYRGRPSVIVADESGSNGTNGAVRIIDVSDERNPKVVSVIRLEIQQKQHLEARRQDLAGDGLFSYDAHYCSVDGRNDPTALACGYFNSGIRVFDIVDPLQPREIAYFNPPAQTGRNARLPASDHAGKPALGSLAGVPQAPTARA